jgi:hypothetical protein
MNALAERLKARWKAGGIVPSPGVPEERLREFEARHGVLLPPDLRDYFAAADGMGIRGNRVGFSVIMDADNFRFWPLSEVVRASDHGYGRCHDDPSSFFLFADHLIEAPAFAIRLTPGSDSENTVISILSDDPGDVVACSFTEFAERYLRRRRSRYDLQS